jgi:hypothetical protein
MIPSYPLRPTNGGPLHLSRPKRGQWTYEPKINGWRAIVHAPTSRMWNRHGKRLSIEDEFAAVLKAIRNADLPPEIEWLDCEALERRHALGKGSLVVLDYMPPDIRATYEQRQETLRGAIHSSRIPHTKLDHIAPPQNDLLLLLDNYNFNDPINPESMWATLQDCNKKWNAEVFEGLVAKRLDSTYPRQLRSPNQESPYWVKHRWEF